MFWVFTDAYCFVGFITQLLYILTPIAFVIQLKNGVLRYERVSIFGLLSLYCTAFIYFWTSIYKIKEGADIDPLDFCNLVGFYLGLVYLLIYIYFIYLKDNKKKGILYMSILIVASLIVWIIIKFTVKKDNVGDRIFSWLGVIFNVAEYFPLGFSIIYLIKKKISEKYTLFGAFFGFLNCLAWLLWSSYSVVEHHANVEHSIVANCLGICLQICQVVLFLVFRKDDLEDIEIEKKEIALKEKYEAKEQEVEESKDPEYMTGFI